jgi:hypothetical protein
MIDEQFILTAERLRDDLADFGRSLRERYSKKSRPVSGDEHRKLAARLAETWLVELATSQEFAAAIGAAVLADLNVHFQRMLTFAEHATIRSRYETELRSILADYSVKVILPLKQSRGRTISTPKLLGPDKTIAHSVFLGQSFSENDRKVNQCVSDTLNALGLKVVTGEKPKADQISEKVKRLIEEQSIFVGIFTRRDKITRKPEWTTSAWVIDEKAYAVGSQKRLILFKEQGVGSIGGIQGDYEYIEFSRDSLEQMAIRLIELFELTNIGLRK